MLRASVLIPTHERPATLPFAVKSVQSQGIDEIEILIVGDGVDDTLRAVIEKLRADDSRIKFFDFPKGPRNGEMYRDAVLRQARGRIVLSINSVLNALAATGEQRASAEVGRREFNVGRTRTPTRDPAD